MSAMDEVSTELLKGQAVSLFAAAGQCLHVVRGKVKLSEAPRWMAEQMFPHDLNLSSGAVHVVETAGWLQLTAAEASTLRWRSQGKGSVRPS